MSTALERAARALWIEWGDAYALHTACSACGEVKACRGVRRARMLCLDCFDAGEAR